MPSFVRGTQPGWSGSRPTMRSLLRASSFAHSLRSSSSGMSVRVDVVLAFGGKHEPLAGSQVLVCCLPHVSPPALQASLPIESVMSEVDIFVSSKRNFNILDHMEELKNNAFSRSSKIRPLKTVSSSPFGAYFDNEIDLADSGSLEGMKVATSSFRASFKPTCEACGPYSEEAISECVKVAARFAKRCAHGAITKTFLSVCQFVNTRMPVLSFSTERRQFVLLSRPTCGAW